MKWTSKFIDLWNGDIKEKRAIMISEILGDHGYPKGRPYYKDTKLRIVNDFEYTEREINESLRMKTDFEYFLHRGIFVNKMQIGIRDYQKNILTVMNESKGFDIFRVSRQIGISTMIRVFCMWMAISKGGNVTVVLPDKSDCEEQLRILVDMLSSLPYFLQPVVSHLGKDHIIFDNGCSVRFGVDVGRKGGHDVLIFDKVAFNDNFKRLFDMHIPRGPFVPANFSEKVFIFSTPRRESFFNTLYLSDNYIFNRHTYTIDVLNVSEKWLDYVRSSISDYDFLVEYMCCMDETKLERVKKIGHLLNK